MEEVRLRVTPESLRPDCGGQPARHAVAEVGIQRRGAGDEPALAGGGAVLEDPGGQQRARDAIRLREPPGLAVRTVRHELDRIFTVQDGNRHLERPVEPRGIERDQLPGTIRLDFPARREAARIGHRPDERWTEVRCVRDGDAAERPGPRTGRRPVAQPQLFQPPVAAPDAEPRAIDPQVAGVGAPDAGGADLERAPCEVHARLDGVRAPAERVGPGGEQRVVEDEAVPAGRPGDEAAVGRQVTPGRAERLARRTAALLLGDRKR